MYTPWLHIFYTAHLPPICLLGSSAWPVPARPNPYTPTTSLSYYKDRLFNQFLPYIHKKPPNTSPSASFFASRIQGKRTGAYVRSFPFASYKNPEMLVQVLNRQYRHPRRFASGASFPVATPFLLHRPPKRHRERGPR